ncbi:transcriptional repressor p66-alpha-like [Ptychodera flava]|uniref:transcriptional repressor p66-alpha-like n=1 Tax=Ptychodera flava TaxID=63121 RepID=UPI003969ECAA
MSDDRVTRSGRRSYPPSPSKSIERRSSTDSSSSERVTRSSKRLRTSDSEDEIPGSPRKSNPPSPTKKAKMELPEAVVKGSKRLKVGEQDDPSGVALELSTIKENNHDADRKPVSNVGEEYSGDDSDPEVSFKEGSFKTEDEKMDDEECDESNDLEAERKQSKQDTEPEISDAEPEISPDTAKGKDNSPEVEKDMNSEGNEKDESVQKVVVTENSNKETEQTISDSVKNDKDKPSDENVPESENDISNERKGTDAVSQDLAQADNSSEKHTVEKSAVVDSSKVSEPSDLTTESAACETADKSDTAKQDNSESETAKPDIPNTDDKDKIEIDKPASTISQSAKDLSDTENKEKSIENSSDDKVQESKVVEEGSATPNETEENKDEVEEMDVDKPHDLSASGPQDLSVTKNKAEGDKDKENNSQSANKTSADNSGTDSRIKKLTEERANSSSPDDVIVLSDDSSGPMVNGVSDDSDCSSPGLANGIKKLTPDEMSEREKLVRKLQEELRNEEAKLLLLKKLRQSQLQPVLVKDQTPNQGAVPGKLPIPRNPSAQPPPLLRGGQQLMKTQQQVIMPPLVRGNQIQPIRTQGSQGPPPLMLGPRGNVHIQQSQMVRPPIVRVGSGSNMIAYGSTPTTYTLVQGQAQQPVKISTPATTVAAIAAESPASRQAAAKLALRKQLEKTLLQIPPPKPPPPEMHFLPSAANNEFIYLVGLEEVVNRITEDMSSPKTPRYIEPFSCSQCKLNFTTVWKRDPKKSNAVMCETCVVTNQKKALKAEHTNRLKTAFVKALQQEQEIEQRMSQSVSAAAAAATVPTNASQAHTTSHHREQLQKVQQEQMRQHHQLLQAHQQQMQRHHVRPVYGQIPQAHIQPTITYAYHVPQAMMTKPQVITTLAQPTDRQREYLLDMIPSRSISQTVTWKQ